MSASVPTQRGCAGQWAMLTLTLLLLMAGCAREQHPWKLKNITGLMPPLAFALTDQNGRSVQAEDYRGQVLLLYFGYTHCPDVCPTTLSRLAQALKSLGTQAQEVRVLFVSVDPARDTPEVLLPYVAYFGPRFVGLSGDQAALRELTRKYRVSYGYDAPNARGDYAVSHSSAVFVFDRSGAVRLLATDGDAVDAVTGDLRRLLAE